MPTVSRYRSSGPACQSRVSPAVFRSLPGRWERIYRVSAPFTIREASNPDGLATITIRCLPRQPYSWLTRALALAWPYYWPAALDRAASHVGWGGIPIAVIRNLRGDDRSPILARRSQPTIGRPRHRTHTRASVMPLTYHGAVIRQP